MNDQDLDGLLRAADPAGTTPTALSATIEELVATTGEELPRFGWRPVLVVGGTLALVGALAAGTDLANYVMTIPPFAGLDHGADFRTFDGLPYVPPLEGPNGGQQCVMYIELGGLTDEQSAAVAEFWPAIDSEEFATGVRERMHVLDPPRGAEPDSLVSEAEREEILAQLDPVVPGVRWGGRPPGELFEEGDPHLVSWIISCVPEWQDLESRE